MQFAFADAPRLYAAQHDQLVQRLLLLSDNQTTAAVPSCPGWSVKDVVAHLSGLVAETLAAVPLPRGSDEATARQVADRADLSLVEVCAEWTGNAADFADFGRDDPAYVAALTSDLVVHSFDIAEALELDFGIDEDVVCKVAGRYCEAMQTRVADHTSLAVEIIGRGELQAPATSAGRRLRLRAKPVDLLLSLTGRRSLQHVSRLDWSADPTAVIANGWAQYGAVTD